MLDLRNVQTTNPLKRLDTIYIPFIIKALIARNVHHPLSPSLWPELQNVVKK